MRYNVTVPGSKSKLRKADYVKAMEKELAANCEKLKAFVDALSVNCPDK